MGFDIPMRTKGALDRNSLVQNYGVQGDDLGAPPQNLPGGQPNNGYNSQGQNNYNNQPNNGYNSQGQNNYNNQPNNGYNPQGQNNYNNQPNNGYNSQGQNNYGNQLNNGYNSQGQNNYNNQPNNGYNSQGQNNYNNQPNNGYNPQGQNNYNNQPNNGYNSQGQNNYNNQPNNGYNPQGQNNYNNQPNNGYNPQGQNNYNNQPNNGYNPQGQNNYNNQPNSGGGFLDNIGNQLNSFSNQLDNSFNDIFGQNNNPNYVPPQVGNRSADTLGQTVSSGGVFSSRGGQAPNNFSGNMQGGAPGSFPGNAPNNAAPPNRSMPNDTVSGGMYQSYGANNGSAQSQPAAPVKPRIKRQRLSRSGTLLAKGQKVPMKTKKGTALGRIKICFGWEPMRDNIELDASAFMLGSSGKVISDDWFIFYGQPESPDRSVKYQVFSEDPRSPDDAAVEIDLTKVSPDVQKIVLAVTMYEASQRRQNFSMVSDLYARITDASNAQEVMRFEMKEGYATVTAMVLGELYRHNNEWKFNSVGSGVNKDLADFCGMYGVALE